ncbi:hypothetical protein ART_0375 [Arthrobacter sp. PAMC 25486]|uniref:hypothetical protein n=1 Tax=Arthrobacter sp. PAMC 25486 TaxID=1494608 RepID=UPI00053637B9|nr:hypothetical protein [Arthrobacter sp. PAMC 25486]AIX99973.1 hypothetical protein ART_0375 [Arthrobacter sp. PAMC 25486]
MSITTTTLTRTAGLSAVAAGLLFIGIQINHPHLDATFATTAEYTIRQSLKIAMAVLSLIGITGMYLPHVKKMGVLGLLGYLVFGTGYLIMMSVEVIGAVVIPTLATRAPAYVNDVFAVATGGHASGDIGHFQLLNAASGLTYIAGGVLFGIALFRAGVLARWASAVLALGTAATIAIPLLPMVNERLFALPTGVALIGLGSSLWRKQHTASATARREAGMTLGSGVK